MTKFGSEGDSSSPNRRFYLSACREEHAISHVDRCQRRKLPNEELLLFDEIVCATRNKASDLAILKHSLSTSRPLLLSPTPCSSKIRHSVKPNTLSVSCPAVVDGISSKEHVEDVEGCLKPASIEKINPVISIQSTPFLLENHYGPAYGIQSAIRHGMNRMKEGTSDVRWSTQKQNERGFHTDMSDSHSSSATLVSESSSCHSDPLFRQRSTYTLLPHKAKVMAARRRFFEDGGLQVSQSNIMRSFTDFDENLRQEREKSCSLPALSECQRTPARNSQTMSFQQARGNTIPRSNNDPLFFVGVDKERWLPVAPDNTPDSSTRSTSPSSAGTFIVKTEQSSRHAVSTENILLAQETMSGTGFPEKTRSANDLLQGAQTYPENRLRQDFLTQTVSSESNSKRSVHWSEKEGTDMSKKRIPRQMLPAKSAMVQQRKHRCLSLCCTNRQAKNESVSTSEDESASITVREQRNVKGENPIPKPRRHLLSSFTKADRQKCPKSQIVQGQSPLKTTDAKGKDLQTESKLWFDCYDRKQTFQSPKPFFVSKTGFVNGNTQTNMVEDVNMPMRVTKPDNESGNKRDVSVASVLHCSEDDYLESRNITSKYNFKPMAVDKPDTEVHAGTQGSSEKNIKTNTVSLVTVGPLNMVKSAISKRSPKVSPMPSRLHTTPLHTRSGGFGERFKDKDSTPRYQSDSDDWISAEADAHDHHDSSDSFCTCPASSPELSTRAPKKMAATCHRMEEKHVAGFVQRDTKATAHTPKRVYEHEKINVAAMIKRFESQKVEESFFNQRSLRNRSLSMRERYTKRPYSTSLHNTPDSTCIERDKTGNRIEFKQTKMLCKSLPSLAQRQPQKQKDSAVLKARVETYIRRNDDSVKPITHVSTDAVREQLRSRVGVKPATKITDDNVEITMNDMDVTGHGEDKSQDRGGNIALVKPSVRASPKRSKTSEKTLPKTGKPSSKIELGKDYTSELTFQEALDKWLNLATFPFLDKFTSGNDKNTNRAQKGSQQQQAKPISNRNKISAGEMDQFVKVEEERGIFYGSPPGGSNRLLETMANVDCVRDGAWQRAKDDPANLAVYLQQNDISVRCIDVSCGRIVGFDVAQKTYISCPNCYAYYCSARCLQQDFTRHRSKCNFARINTLCKKIATMVKDKRSVLHRLSNIACSCQPRLGRGCVTICFPRPTSAHVFLRHGLAGLTTSPSYQTTKDVETSYGGLHLVSLLDLCSQYNPETELVVNISVSGACYEHSACRATVNRCVRLRLYVP